MCVLSWLKPAFGSQVAANMWLAGHCFRPLHVLLELGLGLSSSVADRHKLPHCPAPSAECAPWGGGLVTVQQDVEHSAGGPAHRQGCTGIHTVLHSAQASLPVHLELLLFLSRDALLVSLPPGWVVQVAECLVPSCDTRRAEKLEPSSFDAPVELVIFSAPAPEAVGHPVAQLVVLLGKQQDATNVGLVVVERVELWEATWKGPASGKP